MEAMLAAAEEAAARDQARQQHRQVHREETCKVEEQHIVGRGKSTNGEIRINRCG